MSRKVSRRTPVATPTCDSGPAGAADAAKEHSMRTSHTGLTGAYALPSDGTPGAALR